MRVVNLPASVDRTVEVASEAVLEAARTYRMHGLGCRMRNLWGRWRRMVVASYAHGMGGCAYGAMEVDLIGSAWKGGGGKGRKEDCRRFMHENCEMRNGWGFSGHACGWRGQP